MWTMPSSWPEFMRHDPIGGLYYGNVETRFAEFVLIAQDDAGEVVAVAHSIPFEHGDGALPENGWDFVIRNGLLTSLHGRAARHRLGDRDRRPAATAKGRGCPGRCSRRCARTRPGTGFAELVAPVRPNGKDDVDEPMTTYAFRVREDGLPVDPWLRVHVRAGGRIPQWPPARWSSPAPSRSGGSGPGCRSTRPARSSCLERSPRCTATLEHGVAVYVEPNVWVVHPTGAVVPAGPATARQGWCTTTRPTTSSTSAAPRSTTSRRRRRPPARRAGRLHRRLRVGQVLAGLRHALRRGAAPLLRVGRAVRPPPAAAGRRAARRRRSPGCRRRSRCSSAAARRARARRSAR